ncbi:MULTISPECIES: SRPBCC family protein [Halorubrum]|uniref:Cyclase n=1 Tax=Halorubrum tropicale TaxID=1765655 RepID=A0A0M9ARD9_9EURY|nr:MULTISPECIES: SRPBCC family protein [Halorubrum]KOX97307.1 cyclase [Halorubrum tropicale]TKX41490.1 cyclase [Halorubrum sp. ARQ200]TKX48758.1 cyclase [Halorubrum sp. ASP121]
MPTYRRTTRVPAPIEDVWDFHSTVDGLRELTPDWMRLGVDSVAGADGSPDPEVLVAGSEIEMSVRPFGAGPRQRWTSRIAEREPDGTASPERSARFVDVMEGGPFRRWEHTHAFYADGDETLLVDTVAYRLPLGPLGDAVGPLAKVGFEGMFRDRHRRTVERFAEE